MATVGRTGSPAEDPSLRRRYRRRGAGLRSRARPPPNRARRSASFRVDPRSPARLAPPRPIPSPPWPLLGRTRSSRRDRRRRSCAWPGRQAPQRSRPAQPAPEVDVRNRTVRQSRRRVRSRALPRRSRRSTTSLRPAPQWPAGSRRLRANSSRTWRDRLRRGGAVKVDRRAGPRPETGRAACAPAQAGLTQSRLSLPCW